MKVENFEREKKSVMLARSIILGKKILSLAVALSVGSFSAFAHGGGASGRGSLRSAFVAPLFKPVSPAIFLSINNVLREQIGSEAMRWGLDHRPEGRLGKIMRGLYGPLLKEALLSAPGFEVDEKEEFEESASLAKKIETLPAHQREIFAKAFMEARSVVAKKAAKEFEKRAEQIENGLDSEEGIGRDEAIIAQITQSMAESFFSGHEMSEAGRRFLREVDSVYPIPFSPLGLQWQFNPAFVERITTAVDGPLAFEDNPDEVSRFEGSPEANPLGLDMDPPLPIKSDRKPFPRKGFREKPQDESSSDSWSDPGRIISKKTAWVATAVLTGLNAAFFLSLGSAAPLGSKVLVGLLGIPLIRSNYLIWEGALRKDLEELEMKAASLPALSFFFPVLLVAGWAIFSSAPIPGQAWALLVTGLLVWYGTRDWNLRVSTPGKTMANALSIFGRWTGILSLLYFVVFSGALLADFFGAPIEVLVAGWEIVLHYIGIVAAFVVSGLIHNFGNDLFEEISRPKYKEITREEFGEYLQPDPSNDTPSHSWY